MENLNDQDANLANIREIKSLEPIAGADRIELARFTDVCWQSVVKKGDFRVGEKVVYIQIDVILPDGAEWAQFLKDKNLTVGEPIRLRTAKLRGVISQGLVLPLKVLPNFSQFDCSEMLSKEFREVGIECSGILNYWRDDVSGYSYSNDKIVGVDVSKALGIKKYEKTSGILAHEAKGNFPKFLRRTDENRCQGFPRVIEEFQEKEIYITIKQDGSSSTYYHKDGEFGVCSRNLELKPQDGGKYWTHVAKYNLFEALKAKEGNYAIVGETCGPDIQGNRIGLKDFQFYAFNLWNIDEQKYCDYDELVDFCTLNNIPMAPLVYRGIFDFNNVDELIALADSQKYPNGLPAEGIVVRTVKETYSEALRGRSSFKAISNIFALKYGE